MIEHPNEVEKPNDIRFPFDHLNWNQRECSQFQMAFTVHFLDFKTAFVLATDNI